MTGATARTVSGMVRRLSGVARELPRPRPARTRWVAGVLAFLAAGSGLLVDVAVNLPGSAPAFVTAVAAPVDVAALVGPALAALAIGVTTRRPLARVGLLFAGVFGLLGAVAPPALVPAVGATVAGGALVAVARLPREPTWVVARQWLVAGALVVGTGLSLVGAMGVEPAALRPLGSKLALLAVAAAPVFVRADWRSWLVGLVGAGVVAWFGVSAPFVLGSLSLVGGAVVGASLPYLVLGAGGGLATAATGLFTGRPDAALGGGLLLVAGVPATVPRALAVVVGVALLTASISGEGP